MKHIAAQTSPTAEDQVGEGTTAEPVIREALPSPATGLEDIIAHNTMNALMYIAKNAGAQEIHAVDFEELESPALTDAQKEDFDSYAHSPDTDSIFIVSATAHNETIRPSYGLTNYPAVLRCICLRYTEMRNITTLSKAVTKRLGGRAPTICSVQPDGAATLFYKINGLFPLLEKQEGAEKQLMNWMNAHGLSNIAGAVLDQKHYRNQLLTPTYIGEIKSRSICRFSLRDDALYRLMVAKDFINTPLRLNKELLMEAIEEAGWQWQEPPKGSTDGVGQVTTHTHLRLAAIMTPEGFYPLEGDHYLYKYQAIVGEEKWAVLEASAIPQAICDSYYYTVGDKIRYLLCRKDGIRECVGQEFMCCLKAYYNVAPENIKEILSAIMVSKKVTGVRKQFYSPLRLIVRDGETYVNNSTVQLLQPNMDAPSDRYKKACPAISTLLNSLFGIGSTELNVFLTWLAIAYQGAYYGHPQRGHALYLIGPPGTGKSLLRELVGLLFGRSRSGQEYLCDGTQFNSYALEDNPLVYLDDASVDWRCVARMHNRVKELVASGIASINAKYETQRHVDWFGRVMVACNPAGEGIKLIPSVGADNQDKFIVLQTGNTQIKDQELGCKAREELPDFAHFLKFYHSPLMNDKERFGMKEYISPGIREATLFHDGESSLMECLRLVLQSATDADRELNFTTTELYHELQSNEMSSEQITVLCTPKNIGKKLVKIRDAIEKGIVDFPFTMEQQRTSERRSWVFNPKPSETPGEEDEEQEETPPQA